MDEELPKANREALLAAGVWPKDATELAALEALTPEIVAIILEDVRSSGARNVPAVLKHRLRAGEAVAVAKRLEARQSAETSCDSRKDRYAQESSALCAWWDSLPADQHKAIVEAHNATFMARCFGYVVETGTERWAWAAVRQWWRDRHRPTPGRLFGEPAVKQQGAGVEPTRGIFFRPARANPQ